MKKFFSTHSLLVFAAGIVVGTVVSMFIGGIVSTILIVAVLLGVVYKIGTSKGKHDNEADEE